MDAQAGHLEPDPVIFMVQPSTLSVFGRQGELVVGDAVEKAVREAGGQQLRFPVVFGPRRARGWKAQLRLRTDDLLIHYPDGTVFYDGTMPTTARWRSDVAATGDVVMVTGPVANVASFEPAMAQGLTSWIRIPLAQKRQ